MHLSRLRKGIFKNMKSFAAEGSELFKPSPDVAEFTANDWLKIVGAVNSCGEEMINLLKKYGDIVFFINVDIFYESMEEISSDMKIVEKIERARFFNTRIKEGGQKDISRRFL